MPSCNIIVDSCSYFRLAQNIRPLLKNPFGRKKYCLGVIEELDKEYKKNPTLKNKFFWVSQNEYSHNRKKCFSPNIRQRPILYFLIHSNKFALFFIQIA